MRTTVTFEGKLADDPQVRVTGSGKQVTEITVLVNQRRQSRYRSRARPSRLRVASTICYCSAGPGLRLGVQSRHPAIGAAAVVELGAAERMLVGCGAVREADAVARELRRLGERAVRRVRPGTAAGLDALSSREREVAAMVATGRTNKDIAAALFLSDKTIESHLARIYTKLDVHSRAALTAVIARAVSMNWRAPGATCRHDS